MFAREYVTGLVTLSVAKSTETYTAKSGDLELYYNLSSLVRRTCLPLLLSRFTYISAD